MLHVAYAGVRLEKEVELRQAAEERATAAEHSSSLLQLDLKKAKSELQKLQEDLHCQQNLVSLHSAKFAAHLLIILSFTARG